MSPERKHNLLFAPIVFLVRVPVLLPFYALAVIGEGAEKAVNWLSRRLPSLKREYRP